jgi:hypothetical protein
VISSSVSGSTGSGSGAVVWAFDGGGQRLGIDLRGRIGDDDFAVRCGKRGTDRGG